MNSGVAPAAIFATAHREKKKMFTLKLYQNGPLPGAGRTVILETVGIWMDHCDNGVKHIRAFRKEVGVEDADGTHEFYVGGTWCRSRDGIGNPQDEPQPVINNQNYFEWGVLENSLGKTTEMLR